MTLLTPTDETPTGFELPAFHARLRDEVRDFADSVVAPAAYEYDTKRELPYDIIRTMGDMGLFGLPIPEEYGGGGRDYLALCLAVEQLARADQSIAVTLEAGRRARHDADPAQRHRGAETRVAAAARLRPCARRVRADGGGGRLRCGRHAHDGGARGRPVGDQRLEAVHHQLRLRDHAARHRHRGDRREHPCPTDP